MHGLQVPLTAGQVEGSPAIVIRDVKIPSLLAKRFQRRDVSFRSGCTHERRKQGLSQFLDFLQDMDANEWSYGG